MVNGTKPPTQHIKPAPAIDPNLYIEREMKQIERQYGEKGRIFMEILISSHINVRCLTPLLGPSSDIDQISQLLAHQNLATSNRAAALTELSKEVLDDIVGKSMEVVDCLDSFVDAEDAQLH